MQKGKVSDAEKSVSFVSKLNGHSKEPIKLDALVQDGHISRQSRVAAKQKQYAFWHLFSTVRLAIDTAVMGFC